MGVWHPVPGALAKFTSHHESPEPQEMRLCLPFWAPTPHTHPSHPPPEAWYRSAMWESLYRQHLRNKSDTLLTGAYSEAGGWGIT